MNLIVLVACASRKAATTQMAKDLYLDDLFRKGRAYAERYSHSWHIISGKFGVIDPEEEVEPYHWRRRDVGVLWGADVRKALRYRYPQSEPVHFVFLVGVDYVDAINPTLLTPHTFSEPLRGLMYGERQQWFKRHL